MTLRSEKDVEEDPSKVKLFPTCLVSLTFPTAGESARRVLERAGVEVEMADQATCCGQPAWNSGHIEEARRVAARTMDALAGDEKVVLCSGSCTTMVTRYWPELFEGTDREDEARRVAARTHEFSSFLVDEVGIERLGPLHARTDSSVAYHDSCHMLRELGIKEAPRQLLGAIEGIEIKQLAVQERCCGFGGTFSIRFPELSSAMADEKVDDITAQGAEEVIASDIGCLMQICGRAEKRGEHLPGRYIASIVESALEDDRGDESRE
jgi:L-lactate dehydrogenase complex protein LldE